MSRLRRVTGRQVFKALQRAGFVFFPHEGHHRDGRATVVPIHAGETLGPGLFNQILKDAEIERDAFDELL